MHICIHTGPHVYTFMYILAYNRREPCCNQTLGMAPRVEIDFVQELPLGPFLCCILIPNHQSENRS